MTIEVTQITNISNNEIQVLDLQGVKIRLKYSENLKRWTIGIDDVINERILAPNTDILSEYNLGFYFICECDDENGAYDVDSFLETGNSRLYIVREV